MKVKEESEKAGLKINILWFMGLLRVGHNWVPELNWMTKDVEQFFMRLLITQSSLMASSPITSWQIDGETVADFVFWGSKITADGDCSHEIKRCLLLGRKVMTNIDSILKSRNITLSTKIRVVKAMVFPVVMYGCESWTVKKTECQIIDAFIYLFIY